MRVKNIVKRALSVLLAGAMSMAVFTACGENDKKKSTETLSAKEMLLNVLDTVKNANSISGVFSGEANSASKADVTVEFGEGITDALGTEVKPLSLTSETKLKGSKAGTDIAVTYDGKDLVSLNGVYDNESETVYIKVPELSDAYLSASSKDIKELKDTLLSSGDSDLSVLTDGSLSPSASIKALSKLKIDEYEGIFSDYVKVITDALPEASEEAELIGKIDAVEYNYSLKTYSLTADDNKKIVENVFEKLKNDEKVKELAVGVLGSAFELTDDNYASQVDEAKNSLLEELNSQTENVEISLIYDGDDIVGIKSDDVTFVCVDRKNAYALSVEGAGINASFTAIKNSKKLDINFAMNVSIDEESDDISITLSADDFEVADKENGLLSGDYAVTAVIDGTTIKLEGTDKAEEKKVNSELKISVDDVEYATVTIANEITNASDISIPSGTIYTYDEIEKYQSSMKIDKLLLNIQTALGDDLTEALSSLIVSDEELQDAADSDADGIYLEKYYKEDGSFDYDKLKEDLGEEEYEAFMSQIDLDDFEVDVNDIEL